MTPPQLPFAIVTRQGPDMSGPYASIMFYHAITAHVPGTVKTVPYKAPVDPDL